VGGAGGRRHPGRSGPASLLRVIMDRVPETSMPEQKNQPLHASTSEAVTNNVRVEVESQYAPEHSLPLQNQWFFYYTVRITNEGDDTVQLLSRHWIITDATGYTEEVKGPGVVGEQPEITPGESFHYTSGCPLKTSTGVMRGTYQMVTKEGEHFDIEIAPFALHEPYTVH
jgi:ApaG protein